jgi:hypothetical protein
VCGDACGHLAGRWRLQRKPTSFPSLPCCHRDLQAEEARRKEVETARRQETRRFAPAGGFTGGRGGGRGGRGDARDSGPPTGRGARLLLFVVSVGYSASERVICEG